MTDYAENYRLRGELDKALEFSKLGMKISLKAFGQECFWVLTSLARQAYIFMDLFELDQADTVIDAVIKKIQAKYPDNFERNDLYLKLLCAKGSLLLWLHRRSVVLSSLSWSYSIH
jgi:hypothetical protein